MLLLVIAASIEPYFLAECLRQPCGLISCVREAITQDPLTT